MLQGMMSALGPNALSGLANLGKGGPGGFGGLLGKGAS
jgi:hypothetical protein